MKNTIILCAISLSLLLAFSMQAQAQSSFELMTYNIKYDAVNDQINNWSNRKEHLFSLLKYHQPAIFGTQEGLYHQLKDIDRELNAYTYVGVAREDGKQSGEYSAIFYDSTLFEQVKSGNFWLSETPEIPSKGWDAAYTRICTWAEFKFKKTAMTFYVFNVHLDNEGEIARAKSATVILNKIIDLAGEQSIILMGDFNFTATASPYQEITAKLADSRLISAEAPYGPEATFNGFAFDKLPERRIDYIFTSSNITVLSYATLSDSKAMRYPSDHFPVFVAVQF